LAGDLQRADRGRSAYSERDRKPWENYRFTQCDDR
jgi:hypothetical protein